MLNIFKKRDESIRVVSPINGQQIRLEDVSDEVFNTKMLGEGIAFQLSDSTLYAPCDGKVTMVTPTKHALGILSHSGVEILIHIGLDTVNLKGQGFRMLVHQGDKIKTGMAIVEINKNYMEENHMDLTTPLIITNSSNYSIKVLHKYGTVKVGDAILDIHKK